jgi:hypothetical protein
MDQWPERRTGGRGSGCGEDSPPKGGGRLRSKLERAHLWAGRQDLVRLPRENKRLQMERDILKKCSCLLHGAERVGGLFMRIEKTGYPLTVLPGILHHTDQGEPLPGPSDKYQAALKPSAIVCSTSQRAVAVVE